MNKNIAKVLLGIAVFLFVGFIMHQWYIVLAVVLMSFWKHGVLPFLAGAFRINKANRVLMLILRAAGYAAIGALIFPALGQSMLDGALLSALAGVAVDLLPSKS